jgi:gas vesicle protein
MNSDDLSETPSNDAGVKTASAKRAAGFVAGMLFGAFLGATFALMFAPDRGEKTRGRFTQRIKALREEAREGIDRAGTRTRKELRRRQRRIQAELERARERAEDALD